MQLVWTCLDYFDISCLCWCAFGIDNKLDLSYSHIFNEDLQAKAYMNHGMAPATFQDQTHYFTISLKPSGVQCDFHLVVQELAKGSGTSSNSLRRYALDTRPCRERVDTIRWTFFVGPTKSCRRSRLGRKGCWPFLRLSPELLVLPDSFARLPGGHWRFWGKTTRCFCWGFPIASRMYSFIVYNHV